MSTLEAFRNAYWEKHDREDIKKAQRLQEDIEMLHDAPEALKDDVADLVGEEEYDDAQAKLERL